MADDERVHGEPVDVVLNTRQQVFVRHFTAVLIDLVVLGLFAQYWDLVYVDTFSTALLAALVLQLLLKLTLVVEHKVAHKFKDKPGAMAKFLRVFLAWLVLFGSKFVMLGILERVFGDAILFKGPAHGVIAFIAVVVVMLLAENGIVFFYRWLGRKEPESGPSPAAA